MDKRPCMDFSLAESATGFCLQLIYFMAGVTVVKFSVILSFLKPGVPSSEYN